jgi:hypothetical protein
MNELNHRSDCDLEDRAPEISARTTPAVPTA